MSFSTFQTQVPHPQQQYPPEPDLDSLFQTLSLKPTPAAGDAPSSATPSGTTPGTHTPSSNKPLIPPPSYYDFLQASTSSQFIYFTRLETDGGEGYHAPPQQEYYLPLFTDHYYTLLHEIANMYELPGGVGSIKWLSLRAEGVEGDGRVAELELGLERLEVVVGDDGGEGKRRWEGAKEVLAQMGFGSGGGMGEGVVLVVGV